MWYYHIMVKNLVKCPEFENKFFTKKEVGEKTQCPHKSDGCGARFEVRGNVIKVWGIWIRKHHLPNVVV